ncbi:transcriptional regulator, GntR family [Paracoccus laeviglucosivorans]|uniref:Transcriptional regulator, GntR family n=2 Tax=Paracoccus laeviglucosivorans TaxID=1197861 RepID=A0A521CLM8_9RHOB|nr:transcriptional regulator, GntR family [Paracoccus laeviglucosivorans]
MRPAPSSAPPSEIAERIWLAIAERRLRPGARLKEEELAEIFAVSRARVRQALALLERDGLVRLQPNRGAFVPAPDVNEAADVLFARRIIERRIIERLSVAITPKGIARLRAHVLHEREAKARGDLSDTIRLSGRFHLLLAELLQSDFLQAMLGELISRSSLITAIYRDSAQADCGPDEHEQIIAALERRDADAAVAAMSHHLDHIEAGLVLDADRKVQDELRDILG